MEISNEQNQLLNNVISLRKRYALVDKLSAKPFNIFKILRAEKSERFTHSAFIAELLNPKGSHCRGDTFLNLFLNQISWADVAIAEKLKAHVKNIWRNGTHVSVLKNCRVNHIMEYIPIAMVSEVTLKKK